MTRRMDAGQKRGALLYIISKAVKAGEFLRVCYRSSNKGTMSAAQRRDAAGMAYVN